MMNNFDARLTEIKTNIRSKQKLEGRNSLASGWRGCFSVGFAD